MPFAHIAAINSFNKKLLIIPTSNLIYISSIALLNNNSWTSYALKDSFYATNYIGGFEQRSNLYLFFQNPTLSQIDVFRFNGSEIIKLKSFKIANQYINLNFNELQNNFEIQLIDMAGRVAFDQRYSEAQAVNLTATNFSNGVYFIRVIAKEFTTGQFVVINHTSDQ